jgi:hypothetical protein
MIKERRRRFSSKVHDGRSTVVSAKVDVSTRVDESLGDFQIPI